MALLATAVVLLALSMRRSIAPYHHYGGAMFQPMIAPARVAPA
jgi:hypothetical protein